MKEVVRLIMADYRRGENAAARVWRQAPEQGDDDEMADFCDRRQRHLGESGDEQRPHGAAWRIGIKTVWYYVRRLSHLTAPSGTGLSRRTPLQ